MKKIEKQSSENTEQTSERKTDLIDRRDYLKLTGAAIVGATGSAALSGSAAATHGDTSESSFPAGADVRGATINSLSNRGWNVIDVADHADNTGGNDVSGFINNNVAPETVFKFRAGTYFFTDWIQHHTNKVAFIGVDGADPTIDIDSGFNGKDIFNFGYSSDPASGFVLRNLNFDITGNNTGAGIVNITTANQGAYLKDVDVNGELDDTIRNGLSGVVVDSNAVLSVHNFNLHDGSPRNTNVDSVDDSVGIISTKATVGDVHLGNCKVAGFPNNGVYASKVGYGSNPGKVIVRGGEFFNSDRDQLRVGSYSEIHHAHCYTDTVKSGFDNLRGIWVRHGEGVLINDVDVTLGASAGAPAGIRVGGNTDGKTTIQNSDIVLNTDSRGIYGRSGSGKIVVDNTVVKGDGDGREAVRIFNHPDSVVKNSCIDGTQDGAIFEDYTGTVTDSTISVPGTAVYNASTSNVSYSGSCSTSGSDSTLNTLQIEDDGTGEQTDYNFTVSGALEETSNIDLAGEDDISGSTADGSIGTGGRDTYKCSGDITDLTLDYSGGSGSSNGVTITVDEANNHIVVDGTSDGVTHDYRIAVSGDMRKGDNANSGESIHIDPNGDSATGAVAGGKDDFYYTGEIDEIEIDGSTRLTLTRKYKIAIEDYQDGTTANYTFSVSGSLEKGSKANSNDSISGSTADGQVNGGTDTYIFTGRITDWSHSGAVHTYIDDKEVITPSLGNNTVTIEGDGTARDYLITVIGGLGKSAKENASINSGDTISGRTADGTVGGGNDSYDYRNGVRVSPRDWGGADHHFSSH
jgi:hypothetical protein